jgi:uncharacterized membrane protein YeaQ/YmgE (transglycosylase-associated protein family)
VGWVSWIVFGLLAGAVARIVVPGRHGIGCLATVAVGIVGALIGGLVGQVVLGHKVRYGWDAKPFALAVLGSIILLLLLEAVAGRGSDRRSPRL